MLIPTSALPAFTVIHVAISLAAIASGFVVVFGMIADQRLDRWTAFFLATTVATSVTGFGFPIKGMTPGIAFGVISLVVLAAVIYARYSRRLAGVWRWVYVVGAVFAFYLNFVVLIVQSFQKVAPLHTLAPTQSEPPFLAVQLVSLAAFLVMGTLAVKRFESSRESRQPDHERSSMDTLALLDAYGAGPGALRAAVAGISLGQLVVRPIPGKWSVLEVVCHLSDTDANIAHRLKRVLAEDRPTFERVKPDAMLAALAYHDRDVEEELTLFDLGRRQIARILRSSPADVWQLAGIVGDRGDRTVAQMINGAVEHLKHHLKFVAEKRQALGLDP